MRIFITIVAIITIILLAGLLFLFFMTPDVPTPAPSSGNTLPFPVATSTSYTPPPGVIVPPGKKAIQDISGSLIVNDFTASSSFHTSNLSNYYDLVPESASTTPDYDIIFVDADQSFQVFLLKNPLGLARRHAEETLLAMLGISQQEACSLTYQVTVAYSINDTYAGRNFGFSFCPGSEVLSEIR